MTLDRYVMRLLFVRSVAALVVLIALVQILELFDVTGSILERGLGVAGILRYSMLRIPGIFVQVASMGVLVGSIFTFTQLSRNSEMVVIRATGANIYRVLRMMAPVAFGIALVDLVVAAEIAPRTQDELAHWMDVTAPAAKANAPKPHWFRLGSDLILVSAISEDGARLDGVHIYRRDPAQNLVQEIAAPLATAEPSGWRLHGATVINVGVDRSQVSPPADQDWSTPLRSIDLVNLFEATDQISSGAAVRALRSKGPIDHSPGFYETRLYRTVAEPLGTLVMLLLSAPAALSSLRSDQSMRLMLFGLGSGLLFLVADGLLTAMGAASALPPLLAAWSAPIAFMALAGTVLLYAEG